VDEVLSLREQSGSRPQEAFALLNPLTNAKTSFGKRDDPYSYFIDRWSEQILFEGGKRDTLIGWGRVAFDAVSRGFRTGEDQ